MASRPDIIFADEPTGNLDSQTGAEILDFMRRAVREYGQTIVMVTHDPNAASLRRPGRCSSATAASSTRCRRRPASRSSTA